MGATNVTQLKTRLEELLTALKRFDRTLEKEFGSLDARWKRLDASWDGYAYQTFQGEWNGVRRMLQHYINVSNQYEQYLRERIEALERFERSGGI